MPSTSRRSFLQSTAAAAAAATTVLAPSAWAQSPWPSKPIRIIVPYTAGGFTDQMAR
ncbi:twin-arginine translocation signal domain-containing protein, partial [Delftia sp. BR1]